MTKRSPWSIGASFSMAALLASQAVADDVRLPSLDNSFANPPVLGQSKQPVKGTLLQPFNTPFSAKLLSQPGASANPVIRPHAGREQVLDLKVTYTDGWIRNPSAEGTPEKAFDRVRLRSYQGTSVDPQYPFIAPTIEVMPGDTVRVRLDNQLPQDTSCTDADTRPDVPHCFNGTNLHSHGLWVSPTGNSDNVLLSINPGVKFEYEYNIPADHPAGTFWYHPHRHGSTAIQVGSGMAGALIVRGDRPPTAEANGDLDTLLKPFQERLLVFEQIPYACLDKDGKLKYKYKEDKDKKAYVIDWSCAPNEVGEVISYEQFGPSSWTDSGRFTTVNGRVRPVFTDGVAGQTERWRLVHAGVRDTIKIQFRKAVGPDLLAQEKTLTAANEERFIAQFCLGDPVPYVVAASDGLTMAEGQPRTDITLQPGYRNDLLVNFQEEGLYCVINPPEKAADSVTRSDTERSVLGFVRIGKQSVAVPAVPSVVNGKPVEAIREQLLASAERAPGYTPDIRQQVQRDLKDGFKLSRFVPHPTITDAEVEGQPKQNLVFFIGQGLNKGGPATFNVGKSFNVVQTPLGTYAPQGARPYQPDVVDRKLVLGTAQEWELRSYLASHPFHIHVNPFQIVKILDPLGNDVSAPDAKEADESVSQYAGLKGVWKDTLWVKSNVNSPLTAIDAAYINGTLGKESIVPEATPQSIYRIFIRTRYERYIGEFVLHCHILDHEDQGMMENVSIGVPDGSGGLATAHHHGG
ncbi:multicopper oxidase family protein [Rhizobium paknamense]|uniref:FtsP/CotA-like multicopper oxidase with cupredoxin domain n=1 Tax=Rhizobium paknamense TaxID=1206817 RepID=A0ABU0IAM9_9HYPH|nr:multicopper oxidase family protein [Rhizobium paknamense]MDQ0454356.1 FtsP/CotA-like multicopper oxidase with cupredoxin domain [Rhizobium paknamense]